MVTSLDVESNEISLPPNPKETPQGFISHLGAWFIGGIFMGAEGGGGPGTNGSLLTLV